jgi:hypothetical protein
MPVTGEQVTALRAFLAFDPSYQQLVGELSGSERTRWFGELVYAAFVTAARRRFSPDVDLGASRPLRRAAADRPARLRPRPRSPRRRDPASPALGERVSSDYDDGTHALVMLFGLGELVCDEHFDQAGLDAFLADARALADARLATQSGNQS